MKTVFTSKQVFHEWAAQSQYEGRGGNVSFRDGALYSYGVMIARFAFTVSGARVALVTSRRYSVTTNGHVSAARSALSHLAVFVVPDVFAKYEYEHEKNVAYLVAEYQAELARDFRARNLPYWLSQGEARNRYAHLAEKIKEYGDIFDFNPWKAQARWEGRDWRGATNRLITAHRARDNARNTPEAIARREKERKERKGKPRDCCPNRF